VAAMVLVVVAGAVAVLYLTHQPKTVLLAAEV
jgi:hypothetical protein